MQICLVIATVLAAVGVVMNLVAVSAIRTKLSTTLGILGSVGRVCSVLVFLFQFIVSVGVYSSILTTLLAYFYAMWWIFDVLFVCWCISLFSYKNLRDKPLLGITLGFNAAAIFMAIFSMVSIDVAVINLISICVDVVTLSVFAIRQYLFKKREPGLVDPPPEAVCRPTPMPAPGQRVSIARPDNTFASPARIVRPAKAPLNAPPGLIPVEQAGINLPEGTPPAYVPLRGVQPPEDYVCVYLYMPDAFSPKKSDAADAEPVDGKE